jgi:cytochrome c-type biogenesis protein CcmF
MTPVGLILLFLTGVGPLLAWRKSTIANLRQQFLWPAVVALSTAAGTAALGIPLWASGICFALCAWVTTTVVQEFARGGSVRRATTGTDYFTALVGLFARSRRRYGGYIVHLGIVLVFLGFAGNGFERDVTVQLEPGQQVQLAPFTVTQKALTVTQDALKQMITAELEVTRDGKPIAMMYPARWFFFGREGEPTTEVALRRGIGEDLYLVLVNYDVAKQQAHLLVRVNPLVNWIWFGVGVMILGTGIALLPERALAFATSRVAADGAVTTTLIVILALGAGAVRAHAQHVDNPNLVVAIPRTPLEKDLAEHIVCMCGTCGRRRIGECTCADADRMRGELAGQIKEGKDREAFVAWLVNRYGSQEVLAEPIDKGFNRLAWLLPYGLGAAGIVVVGAVALRWTRKSDDSPEDAAATSPRRQDLEDRLDDELRELD